MKKIMKGLLLTAFVTLTLSTLTGCSTSIKEKFEQWACNHEEVTETVTQATCEKDGELVLTCTKCGKEETKVLDKLGHEERVLTEAVAPTCTEKGHTKTTECSRCHEVLKEGEELPALGHDTVHHEAVAATCTEIGWNAYDSCSRCDHTTYEEIPALGHDTVHHEAVAATCTEIGWNAYDSCSRCDYTTYEEITALGHDTVHHEAQAATCTEIGWKAYDTCSRCDYTTYEEIPALDHADENGDCLCDNCSKAFYEAMDYVEAPIVNMQTNAYTTDGVWYRVYLPEETEGPSLYFISFVDPIGTDSNGTTYNSIAFPSKTSLANGTYERALYIGKDGTNYVKVEGVQMHYAANDEYVDFCLTMGTVLTNESKNISFTLTKYTLVSKVWDSSSLKTDEKYQWEVYLLVAPSEE